MTRAEKVIAFIEKYIVVPEGDLQGQPMRLLPFQKDFIRDVYDNPKGTRRAYLSIARRNGKTGLIAAILLAHIIGPEAVKNSQIASGARTRDQAALVFNLAVKMINANPKISGGGDQRKALARVIPSSKRIVGVSRNVEYRALSADASSNHGMGLRLAILDEVGQVKGDYDGFIEAIETSMGSYRDSLLVAISTQAANDSDLFSVWLDDAKQDDKIVSHLHCAPNGCDLLDEGAWRAANPALGIFRSEEDMRHKMEKAARNPSDQNQVRWLFLNQRVEAGTPFVSEEIWNQNGGQPQPITGPVYAGLDLSELHDMTAFVAVTPEGEKEWGVHPHFWLPDDNLKEKGEKDRKPYQIWKAQGHLHTTPGATVGYKFLASWMRDFCDQHDVRCIGFDKANYRHLKPWLLEAGFADHEVEGETAIFREVRQGYITMGPAIRELEGKLYNAELRHGGHPVLDSHARDVTPITDEAGNKKFDKRAARKTYRRIDGMVALAMALSVSVDDRGEATTSPWDDPEFSLAS